MSQPNKNSLSGSALIVPFPKGSLSEAIVIIEKRTLVRECLAYCIGNNFSCPIVTFPDIKSWRKASSNIRASLVILSIDNISDGSERWRRNDEVLSQVRCPEDDTPVVVLSDSESVEDVIGSLEHGARGYVPTGMALDVTIEALRLVIMGAVFAPADSLLTRQRTAAKFNSKCEQQTELTSRETAVADALRQGKANKLIADELNISQSTVKVHVRNIMKKLSAKNRTEVAVRLGGV